MGLCFFLYAACLLLRFYVSPLHPTFHNQLRYDLSLKSGLRILIQGTKNAYTTLQTWDCVLYTIPEIDGRDISVGFMTPESKIQPLGVLEEGDAEFRPDLSRPLLSAKQLIEEKKLLRIVSSDRSKGIFTIDEYLGDEVFIPVIKNPSATITAADSAVSSVLDTKPATMMPILQGVANPPQASMSEAMCPPTSSSSRSSSSSNSDSNYYGQGGSDDESIELVRARLKVARLELQLLTLESRASNTPISLPPSLTSAIARPGDDLRTTPLSTQSLSVAGQMEPVIVRSSPNCARVVRSGSLLHVSGCNGVDALSRALPTSINDDFIRALDQTPRSLESEAREAFKNLQTILAENAPPSVQSVAHIGSITCVINDLNQARIVTKIYKLMFPMQGDLGQPPLRFVQSSGILAYEAELELDAVAFYHTSPLTSHDKK